MYGVLHDIPVNHKTFGLTQSHAVKYPNDQVDPKGADWGDILRTLLVGAEFRGLCQHAALNVALSTTCNMRIR